MPNMPQPGNANAAGLIQPTNHNSKNAANARTKKFCNRLTREFGLYWLIMRFSFRIDKRWQIIFASLKTLKV